jgi:multiple sugar transport system substrate-binding protein
MYCYAIRRKRRITMSRWLSAALLLTLLAQLSLASMPGAATKVGLTHLMYEYHGVKWHDYLQFMAKRFEDATGMSIEVVISTGGIDGFRTKLLSMVAGGVAPDTADANPELGAPLIVHGMFEDLRPYVQRDRFPLDHIPPVAVQGVTTPSGQLWGIPVSVFPVVTFFNADLFAQHGLQNPRELGEQWTWETLLSSAKRLSRDTDGDGVPESYGTTRISYRWEMQVHQAGGQLYDRVVYPTRSQFNSPEVLRAVEFIRRLYADNLATNHSSFRVSMGNTGFDVVDGPGSIGPSFQNLSFAWDIARQPKGPASRSARVNPDGFQIVSHSKNKAAAWQWIRFLTGDADNQMELARITGRLPSLKEAMIRYPRAGGIELPDNWQAMIETAFDPAGYAAYVVPNATAIDRVVNPIMSQIWAGSMAPATGLQQIHDLLPALLEQ